jgi:hypothetical protein
MQGFATVSWAKNLGISEYPWRLNRRIDALNGTVRQSLWNESLPCRSVEGPVPVVPDRANPDAMPHLACRWKLEKFIQ